tara:strand:+ start:12605 stop:13558 length:954 start_codon:yes stop_codon:yes gene_type:complete
VNVAEKSTAVVSVVQCSPKLFDTEGTVSEVCRLTAKAGKEGADLVLFPEAYVGGYPWGLAFGTSVGGRTEVGRSIWQNYWDSAIDIPGKHTKLMAEAAKKAGVYLVVGVIERDSTYSRGTLFCTLLYFSPDGQILGKHRKLKPTAAERLIWGEGDGSTLTTVDTPFGCVGGLICWENYMPMARMTMYGKGVDIYLAPTADARDRWQATLQHIALEGRCFVLGCNQYVTKEMYPSDMEIQRDLESWPETLCRGGSAIYDPAGECLEGPLYDRAGILTVELEMDAVSRGKFDFDVVGHYARPDVFKLEVDQASKPPITY